MRLLFLPLAFVALAWAYWALSGGSDFEPRQRAEAPEPVAPAAPEPARLLDEVSAVAPTAATDPAADPPEVPAAVDPEPAPVPADTTEALVDDAPEPLPEQPILAADVLALLAPDAPRAAPEGVTVAAASANAGADLRRVTGTRVNVRSGPGTGNGVVAQVGEGDTAEVLGQDGGWVRIRTPDGTEGWMSARFLAGPEG
ncbi:SH3 domain-containing protein [Rubellimicrobium roseum]|uniref:SH3 domain-containing protein n=1 Tax=Rubellimicrobium roseum TaxID=687525 RepID=A0A5C4NB01_9RHOB|nr:SH3 domain-containing protein [Rubellimicrobium roseum]TNC70311.1 SH3 domain-containing protein [Rubellimicrobium roseum]